MAFMGVLNDSASVTWQGIVVFAAAARMQTGCGAVQVVMIELCHARQHILQLQELSVSHHV